jgi:GLPGLI family protein
MKKLLFLFLLLGIGQHSYSQKSGQISYEVVRKVDPSGMRIMINGEQLKPGDPNFPSDIPDTRTFGQKVSFSGDYAKESRDEENMVVRTVMQGPGTGGGAPQRTKMGRPFEEKSYVDIKRGMVLTFVTVGKDKDAKTYKAETAIERTPNWQITDQTKKIAGYQCKKATVQFRNEPYTVWFTTDLPFQYSPIPALTPEKGVALLIEASREQFKATKVNTDEIDPKTVVPDIQAESVSKEQLADIRQKAMADFHQKLMTGEGN